jgi:hypothetical protein
MKREDLLKSVEVWQEIERYKWIESERLGYDIGLDEAVKQWTGRYADVWFRHHARKTSPKTRIIRSKPRS